MLYCIKIPDKLLLIEQLVKILSNKVEDFSEKFIGLVTTGKYDKENKLFINFYVSWYIS